MNNLLWNRQQKATAEPYTPALHVIPRWQHKGFHVCLLCVSWSLSLEQYTLTAQSQDVSSLDSGENCGILSVLFSLRYFTALLLTTCPVCCLPLPAAQAAALSLLVCCSLLPASEFIRCWSHATPTCSYVRSSVQDSLFSLRRLGLTISVETLLLALLWVVELTKYISVMFRKMPLTVT